MARGTEMFEVTPFRETGINLRNIIAERPLLTAGLGLAAGALISAAWLKRRAERDSADQVRDFWAGRNPRGATLYDRRGNPLVDPQLLHASAAAVSKWEAQNPNYRIEV